MSTATSQKPGGTQQRPMIPPPETFWKKYSSRHEFPLSSALAIFLHAFAIGLILLVGFLAQLRWYRPENRPVETSVVTVGPGEPEGGSGAPGVPGDGGKETLIPLPAGKDPYEGLAAATPMDTPSSATVELDPGTVVTGKEVSDTDFLKVLKDVGKEPEAKKTIPDKGPERLPGVTGKPSSLGGVKRGPGGSGSTGFGTGKGEGFGPGTGKGGSGRALTRQEFLARRWKFDLAGSPKVHMDKLARVGFIVGLEGGDNRFYTILDLKTAPVEKRLDNFAKYKDAVQWENRLPGSVMSVSQEMGVGMPVKAILLFLPKDREEKIAREEQRFAMEIGRPLNTFQHIWFDFELRNGAYEPTAKRIE